MNDKDKLLKAIADSLNVDKIAFADAETGQVVYEHDLTKFKKPTPAALSVAELEQLKTLLKLLIGDPLIPTKYKHPNTKEIVKVLKIVDICLEHGDKR